MSVATEKVIDYLNSLSSLTNEEKNLVRSILLVKEVPKKKILVRAGEISNDIFFVNEGLLRLYFIDKEGKEQNKNFSAEDAFTASFASLLAKDKSNCYIQSIEKTSLTIADHSKFIEIADRSLALQTCARKLLERVFLSKEKREYEFLMLSAKERYEAFVRDQGGLLPRIPNFHIASYLGIRAETLSRLQKENS